MATPNRAVFKYNHDDSADTPLRMFGRFVALIALAGLIIYWQGHLSTVLCGVAFLALAITWPKKQLSLGPRYFLCGNTVVYYANVRRMDLRPGTLELRWGIEEAFTLEQERFPTNARKALKIEANKFNKFHKVSSRIIQRVLRDAPDVECKGIDRTSYEVPS